MSLFSLLTESTNKEEGVSSISRLLKGIQETTVPSGELPVDVEVQTWMTLTDPERISRSFVFESYKKLRYFLDEILAYQESRDHHSKITVDHRRVTVESFTQDLNRVTAQDLTLASFCDEVYEDLLYFNE
jgi:pterin-4a-carbinolamine dehydratase